MRDWIPGDTTICQGGGRWVINICIHRYILLHFRSTSIHPIPQRPPCLKHAINPSPLSTRMQNPSPASNVETRHHPHAPQTNYMQPHLSSPSTNFFKPQLIRSRIQIKSFPLRGPEVAVAEKKIRRKYHTKFKFKTLNQESSFCVSKIEVGLSGRWWIGCVWMPEDG